MVLRVIPKFRTIILLPVLMSFTLFVSCDVFKSMFLADSQVIHDLPEEKFSYPEVEQRLVTLANKWAKEHDKSEKWYGAIIFRDWRIHRFNSGVIKSKSIWAYILGERDDGTCVYQEHYFVIPYYSNEFQDSELQCIGRGEYPNSDSDHQYGIDCADLEKYK